jgi:hypothetical protein
MMDASSSSTDKPPKERSSSSKKKTKKKKKQKTKLKDKEYDVLVMRYLKKKGYKATEQKLREEATIDDAAYSAIVQENTAISNLVTYGTAELQTEADRLGVAQTESAIDCGGIQVL